MSKATLARQARRALDARFAHVNAAFLAPPAAGWVRTVREALGMPVSTLAARLHVSRQAVHALEASEVAGNVKLASLRKAAEALDCYLIYAFIPNRGLDGTVRAEAGRLVDLEHVAVTQTMALEGQFVDPLPTDRSDAIDDLIRTGRVWRNDAE